ncbi:MAG: leucine-rich repeat domain-containing protein [Paludibacteraceae bacterium]|nr:leucine-rich repeat domain-containing protein [Paludibacteraceae bacterium]
MRKPFLLSLLVALLTTLSLHAYEFQSSDLYYNITSDNTVEVTYQEQWSEYNYQDLTTATIPETVTYNGTTYFVTSIGERAFRYCSSLTSITIGNSVTSIGELAFEDCSSLTSITIPNSVTSIEGWVFQRCYSLTSIVVESGNIVYDSRENCNAIIETATNTLIAGCQSTTIPNSVTSIGDYAFYGYSSLTSLTLPNSVTSIGERAFSGCSALTSITIPNSVTSIEYGAFEYCSSLTSITIPNSVTSIGGNAFWDCSSLTSITIGNSVTSIGEWAFEDCSSLTSITCYAPIPPTCSSNSFRDVPRTIPLYVPEESVEAYQAADTWNEFDVQALLSTDATETASDKGATKLLRDGQVLIIRNGETYNMTGQRL